jgi:hypothetical protein
MHLVRYLLTLRSDTLFFPDRGALHRTHGTLAQRLANVSSVNAIWVVGQKYYHAGEHLGVVTKLLLPDPDGEAVNYYARVSNHPEVVKYIKDATSRAWAAGTKVRWYQPFIFSSIVLADTDKPTGWVHIEIVLPYSRPEKRPSFTITKIRSEETVSETQRVFDRIWDSARDAPRTVAEDGSTYATPRMPLLDFLALARDKYGWDISGKANSQILSLIRGMRQAGIDKDIRFWGRRNRYGKSSGFDGYSDEPLIEIPEAHWRDYQLESGSVVNAAKNLTILTYNYKQSGNWASGSYFDIHLHGDDGMRWLNGPAKAFWS